MTLALPARACVPPAVSGGLPLELLDQAGNALGRLRAMADPVVHPVEVELQRLFLASRDRVEEPEPLDIAPVAPVAAVGHHHVVERPLFSAAPGQTNRHHESRFPRSCRTQCGGNPAHHGAPDLSAAASKRVILLEISAMGRAGPVALNRSPAAGGLSWRASSWPSRPC